MVTTHNPEWSDLRIASTTPQGDKVALTGIGISVNPEPHRLLSWDQKLTQTTVGTDWHLTLRSRGSLENIRRAIATHTALAVSDGSFQEQTGASAWIIEGTGTEDRIEGSMITPGQKSDQSSFRSEAAGIYGALLTIWHFIQDFPTDGTITLACDGRSVLDRLRSTKTIDPFAAHSDLLRACKNIQSQLTCTIKFIHVKGHQDNGLPTVLSREAWLNIEADLMAKSRIDCTILLPEFHPLPFEPWSLLINNQKVVKHHRRAIRMTMNGPAAQQYWKEKLTLPNSEPTALDTQAMERALSESTPGRRRWVTKHITGHFAHGKNMLRRGQRSTAECPRCHAETEDKQHIIRCPATSARTQWQSSLKKLSQWLKDQGTAIDIRIAIISHLERWAQGENSQEDTEQPFIGEQQHIGWDRMMDGWISRHW